MHRVVTTGALLALLACSATACVGPRLAQCPANGGQPWNELESDHFLLQTDLPPKEAQEALAYLERTRAAMLAAAWPEALKLEMPKLTVHVLAETSQFEDIFPRRVDGVFSRAGDEPFIVLHGSPSSWDRRFTGRSDTTSSTVKHELAHYLSSYFLLRQPLWLAEGLAQFMETLQLSEDGKTAVLGQPHLTGVSNMKTLLDGVDRGVIDDFSMKDVVTWERLPEDAADWEVASRYSGSWLLVHWLYNTRAQQFAELQTRLAKGEDPQAATQAVFPELYTPTLDKTLFGYVKHGSYQELTVRIPLGALGITERALEDAEVHTVRMRLLLLAAGMAEDGFEARVKLARGELDEALRQDPKSLLALKEQVAEAPAEQQLPLARALVEAHPHESVAWLVLAAALKADTAAQAEREAAYKKAVELDSRSSKASNSLAWFYVTQKRYQEALPLAQRAMALAPWNPHVLDTYAVTVAGLGRCSEAILTEQRALELLQEHPNEGLEKELRSRLQSFTPSSCTPPAL
jgi:tetratricopeptide (TPR) repeat protein